MLSILHSIPDVGMSPLTFVFERMNLQHKPNTLWMEFGVASGTTINKISKFTSDVVYGFDSFEGLPEKWRDGFEQGTFSRNGQLPQVNHNVRLIKGWFADTLPGFLATHPDQKVSFLHLDADLYSSTKFILNSLRDRLDKDCVVVFDELVNFPGFDSDKSELKAFYEFITENNVSYSWIGMNGVPFGMAENHGVHANVALIIHSVTPK